MIRTFTNWLRIVTVVGALAAAGCGDKVAAAPSPNPRPKDGPHASLEPPKPGRFCNSPFAIIESNRATCDESLGGGAWTLVKRRPNGTQGDGYKDTVKPQDKDRTVKPQDGKSAVKPQDGKDTGKAPAVSPNDARRAAPGSAPFCVYKWSGKERVTPGQFAAIHATQECAIAVGMGPAEEVAARPFFSRNFDRQARAIASELPPAFSAQLRKADARAPIVAVVDASPWGVTKPDVSGHGYAVSRVIGHLSCVGGADAPDCPRFVKPYVALPLVRPPEGGPDDWQPGPDGGYAGYFHDLFDALKQALDERPADRHLIVNLSLGWDPTTTLPNDPEVQHIRELIERAHCEGVLMIGAAGNGTTAQQAPVFPALLEATPPDPRRCKEVLRIADPKPIARGSYAPLIHAVGSVDLYDERLPTVRAWANPRIAAFGTALTLEGPRRGEYFPPRTGTSMSAAVISGIDAVLWRLKPGMDAAQVMKIVYDGGIPLEQKNHGSRTELCLDSAHDRCHKWPSRRATLCGAVNALGAGAKLRCVTPVHPEPSDPGTAGNFFPPRPTERPDPPKVDAPCDTTNCKVPVGANPAQGIAMVGPMGVATCGACRLYVNGGNGILTGSLDFTSGPSNFDATVVLYDSNWAPHYYYPFQGSLPNGWFWQGLPAGSTGDVIAAEIDWTYNQWGVWWTDAASLLISP